MCLIARRSSDGLGDVYAARLLVIFGVCCLRLLDTLLTRLPHDLWRYQPNRALSFPLAIPRYAERKHSTCLLLLSQQC